MSSVVVRCALLGGSIVCLGCAPATPPHQLPHPVGQRDVEPPPTRPPAPAVVHYQRAVAGRSVQGRDIEMYTFAPPGSGGASSNGPNVLIIGGIHGNEQTSVDVASGLVELLTSQPHLTAGCTVTVLPNTNPDGYAARSRYNARGIDVNRNFAATNFKPQRGPTTRAAGGGRGGGAAPLSEPESVAILRAIDRLQPRLLISIHSIDRGRECNNWDGPGERYARVMSQHNGYPAVASIGYPTPGSLGSYAGIDRQIPMVTLELPRRLDGALAWEQNRDALLAAIRDVASSEVQIPSN